MLEAPHAGSVRTQALLSVSVRREEEEEKKLFSFLLVSSWFLFIHLQARFH